MPYWPNTANTEFDETQSLDVIRKPGVGNFATAADIAAEEVIVETIQSAFPSHAIFCEEGGAINGDDEWRWIVDPIDGTLNFRNGIPDFGTCIALLYQNRPVVGVIAMPVLQQMIDAREGGPAVLRPCDGAPVQLAPQFKESLSSAIVGYNLGYDDRREQLDQISKHLVDNVGYASCLGSYAAGNFRVAQGMMGAYFGMSPTIMDVAAAAVIIPAVGGVVTNLDGQPIDWQAFENQTFLGAVNLAFHKGVSGEVSSMKTLIVENTKTCPAGTVETTAVANGLEVEVRRSYRDEMRGVQPSEFDAIVVLGGFEDAYDTQNNPYLLDVIGFLQKSVDYQKPVLAICLGAQLAAMAFGGAAFAGDKGREVGWHSIEKTDAGRADDLISCLDDDARVMQWHQDTFAMPPGATQLLRSEMFEQQAFSLGSLTAVQFHPEVDESIIRIWHRHTMGIEPTTTPMLDELLTDLDSKTSPSIKLLNAFWKRVVS